MTNTIKYQLDETHIPKYWYNIAADLPSPPPAVLHPGTLKPLGPDDLALSVGRIAHFLEGYRKRHGNA